MEGAEKKWFSGLPKSFPEFMARSIAGDSESNRGCSWIGELPEAARDFGVL